MDTHLDIFQSDELSGHTWLSKDERQRYVFVLMEFTNQNWLPFIETRLESQTLCLEALCLLLKSLKMALKEAEIRL